MAQFGSGSSVMLSILKKKKFKTILRKTTFVTKVYFLKTKMSPKEIFGQLSHWIINLYLKSSVAEPEPVGAEVFWLEPKPI